LDGLCTFIVKKEGCYASLFCLSVQIRSKNEQIVLFLLKYSTVCPVRFCYFNIEYTIFFKKEVILIGIRKDCSCRASAFRAINPTSIPVPTANTHVKVLFPNEQFDLANEYNPMTSTFTAKTDGVYSFVSGVIFQATDSDVDYQVTLQFIINGSGDVDVNTDFTGFDATFSAALQVSDILQLKAGDRVEVLVLSTTPGIILADNRNFFAGARFPSPKA
jgi:hypothetical protein